MARTQDDSPSGYTQGQEEALLGKRRPGYGEVGRHNTHNAREQESSNWARARLTRLQRATRLPGLFGLLCGRVFNELVGDRRNHDETDDSLRLGLHRLPTLAAHAVATSGHFACVSPSASGHRGTSSSLVRHNQRTGAGKSTSVISTVPADSLLGSWV